MYLLHRQFSAAFRALQSTSEPAALIRLIVIPPPHPAFIQPNPFTNYTYLPPAIFIFHQPVSIPPLPLDLLAQSPWMRVGPPSPAFSLSLTWLGYSRILPPAPVPIQYSNTGVNGATTLAMTYLMHQEGDPEARANSFLRPHAGCQAGTADRMPESERKKSS